MNTNYVILVCIAITSLFICIPTLCVFYCGNSIKKETKTSYI